MIPANTTPILSFWMMVLMMIAILFHFPIPTIHVTAGIAMIPATVMMTIIPTIPMMTTIADMEADMPVAFQGVAGMGVAGMGVADLATPPMLQTIRMTTNITSITAINIIDIKTNDVIFSIQLSA